MSSGWPHINPWLNTGLDAPGLVYMARSIGEGAAARPIWGSHPCLALQLHRLWTTTDQLMLYKHFMGTLGSSGRPNLMFAFFFRCKKNMQLSGVVGGKKGVAWKYTAVFKTGTNPSAKSHLCPVENWTRTWEPLRPVTSSHPTRGLRSRGCC